MIRQQAHSVSGAGLNVEINTSICDGSLIFRSDSNVTCRFTFYSFSIRPELLRVWNYVKKRGQVGVVETQQPFKQFSITLEGDYVFLHVCFYDPHRESRVGVEIEGDYYGIMEGYVLKKDFERLMSILVQHTP